METTNVFSNIQIGAKNTRELRRKTQRITLQCMSLFEDYNIPTSAQVMDFGHIWVDILHGLQETLSFMSVNT